MRAYASLLCATAFVALNASPVFAQVVGQPQQSEADGAQLEEIIVTAQKRSENLQDVPIAVSTVKDAALEAAGIRSVIDLRVAVPSLNLTNTNGYLTSNIRGIGSVAVGPGVESAVALYVDGVYIAAPYATALPLNNIDSVEVLKGPQGTLFGRNATGGLVQVITRTPGSTPTGKFELGYANYGVVSGSAYLSGGIAGNLFADIAATARKQGDGWGRNRTTGADTYKNKGEIAVRSKWIWEAGPDTRFTLIGDYTHAEGSLNSAVARPGRRNAFAGGAIAPDLGYGLVSDREIYVTGSVWGASLRADQDIGSLRLSSITAYRKGHIDNAKDSDYSAADLASFSFSQPDRQFSQELQLSSNDNGSRLKWTAGAYYYRARSGYDPLIVRLDFINLVQTTLATERAQSEAVYGQATYELSDSTNLTLGARYTHERRKEQDVTVDNFVISTKTTTRAFKPDQELNFSKVTFRASLDHRFSDQVMGYVSFNRGFKGGGFNGATPGLPPYRPETLDAFEAGLKTDLLDRRLRVNVAGFYYKYRDQQILTIVNSIINVINGAASNIYGADVDVTAVLNDHLTLTASAGLLHPEFTRFPNCRVGAPLGGAPIVFRDCSGKQLPIAARFSSNIGLNYTAPVADGTLTASANAYYNSGFYFEPDNVIHQPRFVQLGSAIKWTSRSGLSIGAFGKNLTNRRLITYGATASNGTQVVSYGEPRTYGVTVGYEF